MMINRRRAYGGKKLPYDAEIEYLESTGTQWIDTGVAPDNNTYATLNVIYTVLDSIYRAPLSVRERDGAPNSFSLAVASVKEVPFAFGSAYWNANPPSLNIKYSASLGRGRATFGTQVGNAGEHISPNGQTAFLFARNSNGTASNFLIGRIFNVEIHKENQTLRDFIPVRKGSVGYMYDKVSGQLFGNQGTGSFILGSDK